MHIGLSFGRSYNLEMMDPSQNRLKILRPSDLLRWKILAVALIIVLPLFGGCTEPDTISRYDIPKSQSDMKRFTVVDGDSLERRPSAAGQAKEAPPVPDGWTAGKTGQFGVWNRFSKQVDEEKVEITVTILPPMAKDWNANVTRWANQQLGLELDTDDIAERTTKVTVDGSQGQQISLLDDGTTDGRAIVGVMIVRDNQVWFFRISGKTATVEKTQTEFDDYLNSFQFP